MSAQPLARIQTVRVPAAREQASVREKSSASFRDHLQKHAPPRAARGTRPDANEGDPSAPAVAPPNATPALVIQIPPKPVAAPAKAEAAAPVDATATIAPPDAPPVAPVAPSTDELAQLPLTPLEQAVHEFLRDLASAREPDTKGLPMQPVAAAISLDDIADAPIATPAPKHAEAAPTAPTADIPAPELPMPTSHVHLVLDDAGERLVLTVAVRGNDVHVAVRAPEDTGAALARNAGALDHALRARGLELADVDVQREPSRERQSPDEPPARRRDREPAFTLEES